MASKGQLTGMRGVYLVAAELSKRGFIASPTSRSAIGADVLVTDQTCRRAFSIQVKTNARTFGFWLLSKRVTEVVSNSHIYALVNLKYKKGGELIEYFLVPSKIITDRMLHTTTRKGDWYFINQEAVKEYQDKWTVFGRHYAKQSTRMNDK